LQDKSAEIPHPSPGMGILMGHAMVRAVRRYPAPNIFPPLQLPAHRMRPDGPRSGVGTVGRTSPQHACSLISAWFACSGVVHFYKLKKIITTKALFRCLQNSKFLLFVSSHRIFEHVHKALNIDKKLII
jgi:hypothetical protein